MWKYREQIINCIEDFPGGTHGFIYEITHLPTGRKYIGKKNLYSKRKRNFGKKEALKVVDKRKKLYEHIISESDWKTYYSSNVEIKALVKQGSKQDFEREILQFVPSSKLLTYYELKWQILKEVIEPGSTYINDNIEGRFFRRDFDALENLTSLEEGE